MSRRKQPNDHISPLIRDSFAASLRPSRIGMNRRVDLLLRLRGEVNQAALAAQLGVPDSSLTRWLNENRSCDRFCTAKAISTMSRVLGAHGVWIETGALVDGYPCTTEPYLRWIEALTSVVAAQLYGALTLKRCPIRFFALLDEKSLRDVRPVTNPFPGSLTPANRDAWNALMRHIPFIHADCQSALSEYYDLIAQVEPNPNRLIDIENDQIFHHACAWAVNWARKISSDAHFTKRDRRLAQDIDERGLRLRRIEPATDHFRGLGVDSQEPAVITAASRATAARTRAR